MRHMRAAAQTPDIRPRERSNTEIVISLLPYLWPKSNPGARVRVVTAVLFMLLAKVAGVYVPILYGRMVDTLTKPGLTA